MIFEFRIFGLFVLFLLILSYFSKDENDRGHFSFVLICSYLLEVLYIVCYVMSKSSLGNYIFMKVYYGLFGIYLLSVTYYFLMLFFQRKYQDGLSSVTKKFYGMRYLFGIAFVLVVVLVVWVSRVDVIWQYLLGFCLFQFFIHFLVLIFGKKFIDSRKYGVLVGFCFVECLFGLFQFYFPDVEIMQSGVVVFAIYFYMFLENDDRTEIANLKLERDYATKNLIQKEVFLKKLSHEIRIPVHTIDGFSQVMAESSDMDEMKEDAKDIRVATSELIHLINSMIDLSILESGQLRLLPENYNVYEMFDDLADMIPSRLKGSDVKFVFEMEKNIPEVLKGDSERISQVILNIISNSIKYTSKGTISLKVSSVKSDSLCRLMIRVDDTGQGMTDEEVRHLFMDDSSDKGIGLRVSYYLVQLMNGKIDVESNVGKGTSVIVTIDQEIIALKQERKERKKKELEFVSFAGKRILIVDDNKLNLKVASKLLLPYEVDIVTVSGGQECLDLLDKDTNFDLILMDDLMPNMSGIETLDVLRKIERVSGYYIPVVALTANATSGMREKYLGAGFDDYLAKPIDREELDGVLKRYLKK